MERHDACYRQYVQILREELRPATGCTEPIAMQLRRRALWPETPRPSWRCSPP